MFLFQAVSKHIHIDDGLTAPTSTLETPKDSTGDDFIRVNRLGAKDDEFVDAVSSPRSSCVSENDDRRTADIAAVESDIRRMIAEARSIYANSKKAETLGSNLINSIKASFSSD